MAIFDTSNDDPAVSETSYLERAWNWYLTSYKAVFAVGALILIASLRLVPFSQYQYFSDYWEHAAAIRELVRAPLNPIHPDFLNAAASRQFMPVYWLLAIVGRAGSLDVQDILWLAGIIATLMMVLGVPLFARSYFRSTSAAVIALPIILFGWGSPTIWAGFHNIRSLFSISYFPSQLVFGGAFLLWWWCLETARATTVSSLRLAVIAIGIALEFTTHELSGGFVLASTVLFVAFDAQAPLKHRLAVVGAIVAGCALCTLWPFFNPWALSATWVSQDHPAGPIVPGFAKPLPILLIFGPALLGLAAIPGFIHSRRRLDLVIGLAGLTIVFVVGTAIGNEIAHRFIPFVAFYLQWSLVQMVVDWRATDAKWSVAAIVVALALTAGAAMELAGLAADFTRVALEHFAGRTLGRFPDHPIVCIQTHLTEDLPADSIVMAQGDLAMSIPAFGGRVVRMPRNFPLPDAERRFTDHAAFYAPGTPDTERREIIDRWGVTHVVFNASTLPAAVAASMLKLGTPTHDFGGWTIIAVSPGPPPMSAQERVLKAALTKNPGKPWPMGSCGMPTLLQPIW